LFADKLFNISLFYTGCHCGTFMAFMFSAVLLLRCHGYLFCIRCTASI